MTGRVGASAIVLETTDTAALKAVLSSVGIARTRSTPSSEIAFFDVFGNLA
ncbi:hypothetical protein GOZ97_16510 [Agrobacterium vitis]|nr:hypothetical protein [Agrobacterium vitis]MUZ54758.1 hypothetical protein [Agrobacterium vitis]MUZ93030.1 hypothetical protein [Agrobacterium vitis]MVA41448.1 hypothetical protein [Agrobacterium vitis]NSX96546.1 hypothetical protein [Agrobacterium vitis]